eukprot:scaffold30710_cov109-Isochrysis_galbana.AAC.2
MEGHERKPKDADEDEGDGEAVARNLRRANGGVQVSTRDHKCGGVGSESGGTHLVQHRETGAHSRNLLEEVHKGQRH